MLFPDLQAISIAISIFIGLFLSFAILRSYHETKQGSKRLLAFILLLIFFSSVIFLPKITFRPPVDLSFLPRIPPYSAFVLSIFFYFSTSWFVREDKVNVSLAAAGFSWLILSVLLNENLINLPGTILQAGGDPAIRARIGISSIAIGWGFFQGLAIFLLIRTYRVTLTPLHRNRYKYWVLITIVSVIGSAFLTIGKYFSGMLILMADAVFITFLSINHQLPDIRQILRKSVNFSIISIFTIAIYSVVFVILSTYPKPNPQVLVIDAILLAGLFIFAINPLIQYAQKLIDRLIVGKAPDSLKLSGEYTRRISTILDLNGLATEIIQLAISELNLQRGELFIITKQKTIFIVQMVNRLNVPPESTQRLFTFSENSPITLHFNRDHQPLFQYDIDLLSKFRSCSREEKEWISSLKMDVFIPIIAGEEWTGLLAFGPKTNRDRYYDFEIELITTFASQASIALQNARLYENLKLRNRENEGLNVELKEAVDELSRLDQAKTDFISIASHEIRTPLTQIIGYNDILSDMIKGGSIQRGAGLQMVEGVRKAGHRLEEIVDTMFDLSKLDTRTLDLDFAETNLPSVISSASERWRNAFEERKLTFSIKKLSNLPVIQADSRRLVQVFSNLIQNAIKYTPDGGHIRVTANEDEKSPYIEIIISDTGIGIAAEDIERIFDKFFRVGNVMLHSSGDIKFKGAGPGLGLTIARGIVEAHRGKIWVESPGHDEENFPGSEFHVLLPILANNELEPEDIPDRADLSEP